MPSLSTVEADEIKRLSRSFKRLDLNQNGSLSADEFLTIPELQQNPLVRRVIDILDTDRNGEVDFQGEWSLITVDIFQFLCHIHNNTQHSSINYCVVHEDHHITLRQLVSVSFKLVLRTWIID